MLPEEAGRDLVDHLQLGHAVFLCPNEKDLSRGSLEATADKRCPMNPNEPGGAGQERTCCQCARHLNCSGAALGCPRLKAALKLEPGQEVASGRDLLSPYTSRA